MEKTCPDCGSESIIKKGTQTTSDGTTKQRFKCIDCSKHFMETIESVDPIEPEKYCEEPTWDSVDETIPNDNSSIKRYVITACQNDTEINLKFLSTLESYCEKHSAELLIVPMIYQKAEDYEFNIPDSLKHKFVMNKLKIHDEIFVMGSFNFNPTAINPLSGLESISRGDTLIVPSPQIRMKSLAVSATRHPAILHTTGAISKPNYLSSKVGERAKFNHTFAAVLVEIDLDNDFHIRTLLSDESGSFYDIGTFYSGKESTFEGIEALVTGDEHAFVACPDVMNATYLNTDSVVNTLKPKYVIRHDVLDFFSGNPHTKNDTIRNIGKAIFGTNNVEDELKLTVDYIRKTSNGSFQNIMVASNHTDHLYQYLSSIDIRTQPWNAKFYFKYMHKIIESMEKTAIGVNHIDVFEEYCKDSGLLDIRFLKRDESFMIGDVELSHHSDKGANGSRGSINQFSNLCDKSVIGHSHTPGIIGNAYQVGTSSLLKLDYTTGISSWMNSHCLIMKKGHRQMINIINKKWKA